MFPRSIVVGDLTGANKIMIVFPTEFVKTQLQLDTGREKTYAGSLDVVRQTMMQRGVTGLYRGVQVLLTGAIPTYALRSGEGADGVWCMMDHRILLAGSGHLTSSRAWCPGARAC